MLLCRVENGGFLRHASRLPGAKHTGLARPPTAHLPGFLPPHPSPLRSLLGALTLLAVPYRCARTPAERAQWAQPDTQLLLSILAYYQRGLSREQLLQAVRKLLALGLNARQAEYEGWVALARADVAPGARCGCCGWDLVTQRGRAIGRLPAAQGAV